jgi:putative hydrolase of the HAD superfamily
MFDLIAFDADDTLWHNESLYAEVQEKFARLLAPYQDAPVVAQRLNATEMRNLEYFGYGIKGFALSMVETAIELTDGQIPGRDIQLVINWIKAMLGAEVRLLEHAEEVVAKLSASHPLMIITKGDLRDQEVKIRRSGLAGYFRHVEVVSDKTSGSYAALLAKHQVVPSRFLMVGNSLRSDILPVVELGGRAVYIPYQITWAHEVVPLQPPGQQGYYELEHLGLLPALVSRLSQIQ